MSIEHVLAQKHLIDLTNAPTIFQVTLDIRLYKVRHVPHILLRLHRRRGRICKPFDTSLCNIDSALRALQEAEVFTISGNCCFLTRSVNNIEHIRRPGALSIDKACTKSITLSNKFSSHPLLSPPNETKISFFLDYTTFIDTLYKSILT